MEKPYIQEILREYELRRDRALYEQRLRKEEIYLKIPRLKEIDDEISKTGLLIATAMLQNPQLYEENLNKIKAEMEKLKREKAILMTENNFPLEYLDVNYLCNKCSDTGFLKNGSKCNCLKQEMINRAYRMSGVQHALEKENFKTFNINIFSPEPFENEKLSPRENMLNILNNCEGFCINFDEDNEENLLFYGTTGLGKTFMCNCIAKALLDRGKIVIYQTAFKILEIIEEHRFRRNSQQSMDDNNYNLLFDADLLIIDDLGTELTNTFTNTEIFNIINSRLLRRNKTIISTNLSLMEIANTYDNRTFSRVFGKFAPLKFYGPDLRWEAYRE
ncbi:DNA replication protein DnaC [Proteiniborus ethanoligenes]|uniref:DNA replication protein DnaC n=1 Tax=Proteiniborus ethanoligenes TaxID=415015 RepID=A0A1H3RI57_9FIRM|nr:ATP-binding protein [Proteiniborus ethanoligenes]SDZ24619.1 DNA replication protein DnaC [Proteiniborus ethanoligenes]